MAEKRNYALRDAKGKEIGVFSGKQPRQAALKAANRGYKDIRLGREGLRRFIFSLVSGNRHRNPRMRLHGCPIKSGNPM